MKPQRENDFNHQQDLFWRLYVWHYSFFYTISCNALHIWFDLLPGRLHICMWHVPCLPQSHILLCKGFDLGILFGLLGPKLIARKQQEAHLKNHRLPTPMEVWGDDRWWFDSPLVIHSYQRRYCWRKIKAEIDDVMMKLFEAKLVEVQKVRVDSEGWKETKNSHSRQRNWQHVPTWSKCKLSWTSVVF